MAPAFTASSTYRYEHRVSSRGGHPQPGGERIIRRYTLRELLDKLDELTPHERQ